MPKTFFLLLLVVLFSCKQNYKKDKIVVTIKQFKHSKAISKKDPEPTPVDTVLETTNSFVDHQNFSVQRTIQGRSLVFNAKKDTIFNELGSEYDYASSVKFKDFNTDGYKDIIITYPQNTPGIIGLLLYNKTNKTYKKVSGFDAFPAPEMIPNTKYYYSYHHSGCADMDWTSDLFCIENYKAVKLGTINGNECGDSGIKDGIYIYKIVGGKEIKIKQLSIKTIYSYKEYKWGFIKSYWYKNYRLFK
ncbi:hypothetical protein ACVW0P_001627 [Mucilaginibacter sp. UYNi724]